MAILAKLIDRLHNVRSLGGCSKEKRERQIKETKRYHLRMLLPALRGHGALCAAHADKLQKLFREALKAYM